VKRYSFVLLFIVTCFTFTLTSLASASQDDNFAAATGKKLIEYGWDRPSPQFVKDHIRSMEKQPFEGVIMKLPHDGGAVFDPKNWTKSESALQGQIKVLSSIQWGTFTDNFLAMYAASDMDWYNDADWKKILSNVRFVARAAKAGNCVGLMFDPEPYGANPWRYSTQAHADSKSFYQYSEQAYQRGRQFMQAMQSQMPQVKVIVLHGYSIFYGYSSDPDYQKRMESYANQNYGLLMPFWNGMLDAANTGSQLIDGNESSYYYQSPNDFYKAYWTMRQGARINTPYSLKAKFDEHERAANAIYPDHLFGMRSGQNILSNYMTPQQRQQWLEQNVYYALKTSDEYVWFYGQRMNWWAQNGERPGVLDASKTEGVPPAIKAAVIAAREKLAKGESLGFTMDDAFAQAQAKQTKLLKDKLLQRSAKIPPLKSAQAPRIDGKLDEKAYAELPWLQPFVGYLSFKNPVKLDAKTQAWLAYDAQNLYITVRCDEPDIGKLDVSSKPGHDVLPSGDYIDIGIIKSGQPTDDANAAYYHLILSPNNAHWDGINTGTDVDLGYNPDWKSGVSTTSQSWTAEMAIPWSAIDVTDVHAGLRLHANIARKRAAKKNEYSSWSQLVAGFQAPQYFGTWTLQ